MSDYSKTVDFATKDTLPSGNADKIIKGAEIDAEFVAIQTAVNSKADTNGNTFTGDVSFGDNVKAKFGTSNDLEIFHTKTSIYDNLISAGIPLLSCIVAAFGSFIWAGLIYWLYAIAMPLFHTLRERRKKKLFNNG